MKCPYCGSEVKLTDSAIIYNGRSYGMAYVCSRFPKCDAYVGCHKGTDKPLGRLANAELRQAKSNAHQLFDALWKRKIKKDQCRKKDARSLGYKWLAKSMGLRYKDCHIGMFDVDKCNQVINLCMPFFNRKGK